MSTEDRSPDRESEAITGAIGELREGAWVAKSIIVPAGYEPTLPTLSSSGGPAANAEGAAGGDTEGASGS